MAGTDPTGYCSTGTHIKGKDAVGCSVAFDAGSGGSGKKKSEAKVTSNGAPQVQQKMPANIQTSELNGQGQNTSKWDNATSTEQLLKLGQGLIDNFNNAGGGNWLFSASTAGGAAELAFSGTSLASSKGAAIALFATGTTMNEWAIIRGASQTAGSYSLDSIGMFGKGLATMAGGAALGIAFAQNYLLYKDRNISSSEFVGKTIFDFSALRIGSSSPIGFLGASLYGATDMMYKSNNLNYQKASGIIQMKRDVIDGFNGRYNNFYENQKLTLPYNVNPWQLLPNH